MTSGDLWNQLVTKHPALESRVVEFSQKDIRKFYNFVFTTALEKGEQDPIAQESAHTPHPSAAMPDFMRQFFGSKR